MPSSSAASARNAARARARQPERDVHHASATRAPRGPGRSRGVRRSRRTGGRPSPGSSPPSRRARRSRRGASGSRAARRRSRTPAACCTSTRARRRCGSRASSGARRGSARARRRGRSTIVTPGRPRVLLRARVEHAVPGDVDRPGQEVARVRRRRATTLVGERGGRRELHPLDRLVRREVHVSGRGVEGAQELLVGRDAHERPRPRRSTRPAPAPPRPPPSRAFAPHDPVTTRSAAAPSRSRFIGTIANCIEAPPWQNRTRWSSPISRSARRLASASSITPSNQAPRWETSSAEAPTPGSVGRSAFTCSRTDRGRTPGPAEKLMTRPSARTEPGYRGCAGSRSPACTPSATAGWPTRRRR